MDLVRAVITDLYTFAMQKFVGTRPLQLAPYEDSTQDTAEMTSETNTFRSTADIISTGTATGTNTVMYTGGMETPIFQNPTMEFDGVIALLPYAAMLIVLENRGRWAKVAHNGLVGWILREELVDRAAHVYPYFVIGERNGTDDPNTIRLRAAISDEYSGGVVHAPLQQVEYVHYRLLRKGITIPWDDTRPRTPGTWQTLLKGRPGVHISVHPKTGAIMEFVHPDGSGHLAYVEAVFPDETISISEADHPEDGIYNERVLTREEWRELSPVFIEVM